MTTDAVRIPVGGRGAVADAMLRGNWSWIAGWLNGRFGVAVREAWVGSQPLPNSSYVWAGWSDGSWAMWWKRRLDITGLLPAFGATPESIRFECELHTGGTWYSTPDELARVENWDLDECDDVRRRGTQTPGISRVTQIVTPIDRTAARVVPARARP